MRIGFTGTRRGCTEAQLATLRQMAAKLGALEFHHGDCVGADKQAFEIFSRKKAVQTHAHPSDILFFQAETPSNVRHPPKPPLVRNRDIVRACALLIACPHDMEEQRRGGTWATIRYARQIKRWTFLLYPDGTGVETFPLGTGLLDSYKGVP